MEARRNRSGARLPLGAIALAFAVLASAACGVEQGPPAEPSPTLTPTPAAPATTEPSPSPTPLPSPSPTAGAGALIGEGYALLRAGLAGEAEAAFARAAANASDPRTLSAARLGEATAAYDRGARWRALALLWLAQEAAPRGSPEEARAVYLLGVRLNEAGAFDEAVALLRPHAALGGGLALAPWIVSEYARAFAGAGERERAETVWDALLATPDLSDQLRLPILRQRADFARRAEDLAELRRWLGELVAITADAKARHELAAVAFRLGDLDLFEAQLRAIIAESPSTDEALQAIEDLRRAGYEVDAGDEGYALYRHREFARARAVLTPAVAEAGISGEALAYRTYFLAAAYDDDGFYLEAVPLYDAVAAHPQAGGFAHRARYWAARALESAGRLDEAATRYDAVARERGAQFAAEAAFRSGFARMRSGDAQGALEAWAKQDAAEARTHYWRGRALEALGEREAAQAAWLEALAAQPRAFHGLEARRALGLPVPGDGRYRALSPPPRTDWRALAAWLATSRPGALTEAAPEARELALVGLRGRASETVALAAARTSDPWALLSLARTASEASLPEQVSAIATRLQQILGISDDALPDALARLRYPLPHAALLEAHGGANGLDPLLLAALIHQESRWRPDAVSIAHAAGLTQVIEPTAAWIAERLDRSAFVFGDLFRPATAIEFGAYYLGVQLRELGDPHHALAAYNAGPASVARWKQAASSPPAAFVEAIAFQETRLYVQLVMEHYAWYRALYGEGTGG